MFILVKVLQIQNIVLHLRIINSLITHSLTYSIVMKISTATLRKVYTIRETATNYIFTNSFNVHIELNKLDGSYIDGNIKNNEETQKLFRALYKLAKSI